MKLSYCDDSARIIWSNVLSLMTKASYLTWCVISTMRETSKMSLSPLRTNFHISLSRTTVYLKLSIGHHRALKKNNASHACTFTQIDQLGSRISFLHKDIYTVKAKMKQVQINAKLEQIYM